jgi:hypothetical protein
MLLYIFLKQWIVDPTLGIPITQCDAQNAEHQVEMMAVNGLPYAALI